MRIFIIFNMKELFCRNNKNYFVSTNAKRFANLAAYLL